jgi:hypothetical protein
MCTVVFKIMSTTAGENQLLVEIKIRIVTDVET